MRQRLIAFFLLVFGSATGPTSAQIPLNLETVIVEMDTVQCWHTLVQRADGGVQDLVLVNYAIQSYLPDDVELLPGRGLSRLRLLTTSPQTRHWLETPGAYEDMGLGGYTGPNPLNFDTPEECAGVPMCADLPHDTSLGVPLVGSDWPIDAHFHVEGQALLIFDEIVFNRAFRVFADLPGLKPVTFAPQNPHRGVWLEERSLEACQGIFTEYDALNALGGLLFP